MANTVIFAVLSTAIKLPLSLLAALVLTRKWLRGKRIFRTMFFAPLIIQVAMAGLVFSYLLNPSTGALNSILRDLGVIKSSVDVFAERWTALLALVLISVWQIFGQYMLYWMAALQNVPEELYEAAKLDGAGFLRTSRLILPLAKLVIAVVIIFQPISSSSKPRNAMTPKAFLSVACGITWPARLVDAVLR
jgi:ABC-type sugar transport system permease subunit